MIWFETTKRDKALLPHDPFKGMVAPRPIGWISTKSRSGAVNLAPYSFFNGMSSWPPIVAFASEAPKDSHAFATETGEFVWSMATWDLRDQMNATSAGLPRGQSEYEHAGLEMASCRLVSPPRVAASPASLECKVTQVLQLKDIEGRDTEGVVVFGQVVAYHLDERCVKDGRFDIAAAKAIARCGYHDYAVVERVFSLKRPESAGNAFGGERQ